MADQTKERLPITVDDDMEEQLTDITQATLDLWEAVRSKNTPVQFPEIIQIAT